MTSSYHDDRRTALQVLGIKHTHSWGWIGATSLPENTVVGGSTVGEKLCLIEQPQRRGVRLLESRYPPKENDLFFLEGEDAGPPLFWEEREFPPPLSVGVEKNPPTPGSF